MSTNGNTPFEDLPPLLTSQMEWVQGSIGSPWAPPAGDPNTITFDNLHGTLYGIEAQANTFWDFFTNNQGDQGARVAKEAADQNQFLGFLIVAGLAFFVLSKV